MPTGERRRVEDFLELPYGIGLTRADDGWLARVEELDGCEARGSTPDEAAGAVREAMAEWIGAALADGRPVPTPRAASSHSGRLLVRMPPALHAELARRAERERTSLNTHIVSILGAAAAGEPRGPSPTEPTDRARLLAVALKANLVVVLVAAVVAVGLLVLAWQGT